MPPSRSRRASSIWKSLALMSRLRRSLPSRSVYVRGVNRPSMYTRRPFWIHCCARSARVDQQLTRYQSVCSCRSSALPVTRLTATLNSQTERPFGVIRSSGSRPTLPMMTILLTEAMSHVPSHYEVAEDVFREPYGALELARLRRRQGEFDDTVLAVTVVGDLVGEPALLVGYDLLDLAAEVGDGLLDALAHRAQTLFVDVGRAEVHELVRSHSLTVLPFHGLAADLWPGAKRRRARKARRYDARPVYRTEQQNASVSRRSAGT